jgi:hypothetical protein
MKIIISTGWSLAGSAVFEKREAAGDVFDEAAMLYADELFTQYPDAGMAHVLHSDGAHWYKSRADLGKTFERNGKMFSAGWTYNTEEGD